jgi:hypothetical protein
MIGSPFDWGNDCDGRPCGAVMLTGCCHFFESPGKSREWWRLSTSTVQAGSQAHSLSCWLYWQMVL